MSLIYIKVRNSILSLFLACILVLGVGLISAPGSTWNPLAPGTANAIDIRDYTREEVDALAQKLGYSGHTPENMPADMLERCKEIYTLSREYGLNPIAAEAQVINNIEESFCTGDINEYGGGGGYGIFQYTAENRTKYEAWADENGKERGDISAQIQYWYEIYSSWGFPDANFMMKKYCVYATDFFSCDNMKQYQSLDEWKQADNIVEATFAFMSVLERPDFSKSSITTNRLILAMYLQGTFSEGDTGGTSDKSKSDDKDSDSGTLDLSNMKPLADDEVLGYVKQGTVEGGKDIELKSRDSLTVAEEQSLALSEEYIEANKMGFSTWVQVAIAFVGLSLILYGIYLVGVGALDTTNTFLHLPLYQVSTFGLWRVVHFKEDASFKDGRVTFGGAIAISMAITTLGIALASGVLFGIFGSIIKLWF